MELLKFKTIGTLVNQIVDEMAQLIQNKPNASICIAAGETPIPVMHELARRSREGQLDLTQVDFLSLDEWIGLTPQTKGTCYETLTTNLFSPANIQPDHIHFFKTDTDDVNMDIERINTFVEQHGIDYILLGIGMNGHIGFNEPGVKIDTKAQVVPLSATTKRVMAKYFDEDFPLEEGVTLGFSQILSAGQIVLMATTKRKAEIVRETVNTDATPQLPSTVLKLSHNRCLFYVDEEAGSLVQ